MSDRTDRNRPLYMISVAAQLAGVTRKRCEHMNRRGSYRPSARAATPACTRRPTSSGSS